MSWLLSMASPSAHLLTCQGNGPRAFPLRVRGRSSLRAQWGWEQPCVPADLGLRAVSTECPGSLVPVHPLVPFVLPVKLAWGPRKGESQDLSMSASSPSSIDLVIEPSPRNASLRGNRVQMHLWGALFDRVPCHSCVVELPPEMNTVRSPSSMSTVRFLAGGLESEQVAGNLAVEMSPPNMAL